MKEPLARKTARERYIETLRGMEPDKVLTARINELERRHSNPAPADRDHPSPRS